MMVILVGVMLRTIVLSRLMVMMLAVLLVFVVHASPAYASVDLAFLVESTSGPVGQPIADALAGLRIAPALVTFLLLVPLGTLDEPVSRIARRSDEGEGFVALATGMMVLFVFMFLVVFVILVVLFVVLVLLVVLLVVLVFLVVLLMVFAIRSVFAILVLLVVGALMVMMLIDASGFRVVRPLWNDVARR